MKPVTRQLLQAWGLMHLVITLVAYAEGDVTWRGLVGSVAVASLLVTVPRTYDPQDDCRCEGRLTDGR